jgi:hypothetical protein
MMCDCGRGLDLRELYLHAQVALVWYRGADNSMTHRLNYQLFQNLIFPALASR